MLVVRVHPEEPKGSSYNRYLPLNSLMGELASAPALLKVNQGKNTLFIGNVGIGVPPVDTGPPSGLTVAGNISAYGVVFSDSGTISPTYIFSNNYLGIWNGGPISGSKVSVEGIDIKSTSIPASGGDAALQDLYLKASGDGTAVWDTIEDHEISFNNTDVDGNLIVRGDIIEYAANGIVYSKTSVFTGPMLTGANTLNTFNISQFKTAKYIITLSNSAPSSTACEVLVTHDGDSVADGTTYSIVDAQATSLLSDITASIGSGTINLVITTTADCTATVYGVAHY